MKTQKISGCEIKVPPPTGSIYETPHNLPKFGLTLAVGKKGSGKSLSITQLFRMYKEQDKKNPYRIIICSATFASNWNLMEELGIDEDDVLDPDDPDTPYKMEQIVISERDDLLRYYSELKLFKELEKMLKKTNTDIDDDSLLLNFYDPVTQKFRPPEHKWGGKKVAILCAIDDAQNSLLFGSRKFLNMMIKNRHIAPIPVDIQKDPLTAHLGSAMGLWPYICIQNYSAKQNGCPKSIRNNISQMILFKTASIHERKLISEEVAGCVDVELFEKIYNVATEAQHDFLYIDLDSKKHFPSRFRWNWNKFLIADEIMLKEIV